MCPDDSKQRKNNTTTTTTTNTNTTNGTSSSSSSPCVTMMISDPLSISISKPFLRSSVSLEQRHDDGNDDDDDGEPLNYDDTTVQSSSSSTTTTTTTNTSTTYVLLRLTFCAVGICTCYICYGIFHEKLLRSGNGNGSTTANFMGPSFILFTQCITNVIVAMIWQQIQSSLQKQKQSSSSNHTAEQQSRNHSTSRSNNKNSNNLPHRMLVITSLCYVCAMICSNEAIPHVSYPVAVLGKSCKLIPTMIIGQVISYTSKYFFSTTTNNQLFQQIAHTRNEWIAAICICIGIVTFHYHNPSFHTNNNNQQQQQHSNDTTTTTIPATNQMLGIYLLCTSLFMDGLLSVCQNILKKSKPRSPSAVETMYYINLYAVVSIGLFCYGTGQFTWLRLPPVVDIVSSSSSSSPTDYRQLYNDMNLTTLYSMIQPYISLLQHLCILNIAAAFGQIFIFLTITWFTPVITTMITTTRKFITILLSVVLYGHSFTIIQWFCIIFIFFGLYIAIIGTTTTTKSHNNSRETESMQHYKKTR